MKEYRAKQKEYRAKQNEEENDESEDIDDDNVSTTSSTNNNIKVLSNETIITCECGVCYQKSYKSRHFNGKAHLEGLKKKQEPQEEEFEFDKNNNKLRKHKIT
jgi:hypothetical protein